MTGIMVSPPYQKGRKECMTQQGWVYSCNVYGKRELMSALANIKTEIRRACVEYPERNWSVRDPSLMDQPYYIWIYIPDIGLHDARIDIDIATYNQFSASLESLAENMSADSICQLRVRIKNIPYWF